MALGLNRAVLGTGFDPDARAYLAALQANASGHANPQAVNKLVAGLKKAGLWTKLNDIALFVGVTNLAGCLVKLRTTTATPLLTSYNFVSGDFATNDGLKGNASSKYLSTGYSPASMGDSLTSFGLVGYTKDTAVNGTNSAVIGKTDSGNVNVVAIARLSTGGFDHVAIGAANNGAGAGTNSLTFGFIGGGTNGSRVQNYYVNGVATGSTPTATGTFGDTNPLLVFGAWSYGSPAFFTSRTIRMYAITTGLLATDHANFYTLIQAYMTTFGANV